MLALYKCQIVVTGDLSVHVEDATINNPVKLTDNLDSFVCTQHVPRIPTHRDGGKLDLNITKSKQTLQDIVVDPPNVISDHSLISWRLPLQHQPPIAVHRRTKQWMKLDKDDFLVALLNSFCSIDNKPESATEYFDTYHLVLTTLADHLLQLRRSTSGASELEPGWTMNVVNIVASHAGWIAVTGKRCNQLISSRGWNRNASGTKHTVGRKTRFGICG